MTLKSIREKSGKTQLEVAILLKVFPGTFHRWECGISRIPADVVPKMAKLYGVTDTEILKAIQALKNRKKESA